MRNFLIKYWVSITFLAFFLLGAIGIFIVEINVVAPVTERERGLFNAIEFGLAIGIGWIFQRIASQEEFQNSLKQFALSAYRRINDINKSVVRLNNEIERMRSTYPKEKMHELDLLRSISDVMNYTVQSSISDWSVIIGEEVRKKEKIEELQKEKQSLEARLSTSLSPSPNNPDINQRLSELKFEIDKLRSDIPSLLQYDLRNLGDTLPREGRLSEVVLSHFNAEISAHSCISLTFTPFIKENEKDILGGSYVIRADHAMGHIGAIIYDKNIDIFGQIENQFPDVYSNDYIYTVLSIISVIVGNTSSVDEHPPLETEFRIEEANIISMPYGSHRIIKIPATVDVLGRG